MAMRVGWLVLAWIWWRRTSLLGWKGTTWSVGNTMRWIIVLWRSSAVMSFWVECCEQGMVLALRGKGVEEVDNGVGPTVEVTEVRHAC